LYDAAFFMLKKTLADRAGLRTLKSDANRTLSHADLKEAPKGQNISFEKWQKT